MNFVEVLVADASYHQNKPLTYSVESPLKAGTIVSVSVRQKKVTAVVVGTVGQPNFKSKPIGQVYSLPPLPPQLLQLVSWMTTYYPGPLGMLLQMILPKKMPTKALEHHPLEATILDKMVLTEDQKKALAEIVRPGTYMLHGETGTGKTKVYIELAGKALKEEKSSIILAPEIGLTSQIAREFQKNFGKRVIVIHSGLTEQTRLKNWQYILEEIEPLIIIGARSALFSPMKSLGLIVVDESHETSYKQDQSPYYHANSVAAKLASLHGAVMVMGSATPSITDYYFVEAKKRPIVQMKQTAVSSNTKKQDVIVVDLKDKRHFSSSPYISNELIAKLKQAQSNKTQSLLFLNRRGTARVIICENCGWQATCPHCDLPLVYHADSYNMRCHSCSFSTKPPNSCPDCKNATVVFKSVGTKAIAEEVDRLFPAAKVMRFDNDNKKSERIEQHYDSVKAGEVDIVVGTQTLAKGLDLPKLSTIGVIVADTSLFLPDFSAQERTYQLLHQVLGRVNRGHQDSHIVIQTYQPESDLLKAVLKKDWHYFYNKELDERKKFAFPPYFYLLKITCKRATSQSAQKAAEDFAKTLSDIHNIKVEGPAPSFHEKSQGKYIWQIIIKSKERRILLDVIKKLPNGWSYDIDPMNLL